MQTGKHLIAGTWVAGSNSFTSSPASGAARSYANGTAADVDAAMRAAEAAFPSYSALPRPTRAAFLERIADEIEARGPQITAIGTAETGLPAARLEGERGRTTGQLRLFAAHIRDGGFLDRRIDAAQPDRQPAPRPEIRIMQMAIGPVAVFGASNFPLAFSTAGGDTASALAAGCPVVVKGHPAHPGTGEIITEAIEAAIKACAMPAGVFSLVQSNDREAGEALVTHPLTRAVGFTGSLAGGRALFDLCAQRPEPIPFFGELGSVNPMFLLPAALAERGPSIAADWAGSLTMGAGQFCTNPGLVVLIDGPAARSFTQAACEALSLIGTQTMLTDGIATAFRQGRDQIAATAGVRAVLGTTCDQRQATPQVFEVSGADWLANPALGHEVFGPLGLIVHAKDAGEMLAIAARIEGQLTCSLHLDAADHAMAQSLLPLLGRKAGRLLANGFPTGVEVGEAQVHGGPYPASTNFGATSVGTMAIRRWLRPVAFQNFPADLLPQDLA